MYAPDCRERDIRHAHDASTTNGTHTIHERFTLHSRPSDGYMYELTTDHHYSVLPRKDGDITPVISNTPYTRKKIPNTEWDYWVSQGGEPCE